jgi:hypothetical protein
LEFEEPAVYKAIPVAEAPFTGVLVERIDLSLYVQAGATDYPPITFAPKWRRDSITLLRASGHQTWECRRGQFHKILAIMALNFAENFGLPAFTG